MAPYYGPDRAEVLRRLRGWLRPTLPITLGRGAPTAVIDEVRGAWTLRPLVLDTARRDVAYARALAAEPFFWMPEHEFEFLEPGPAVATSATRQGLASALEDLDWTW